MNTSIISLTNVSRSFTSGLGKKIEILKSINLTIEPGSFNVIRGESGSGKTTILRILGMLDRGFTGDYDFGNHVVNVQPDWFIDELRAKNLGFIFQEGRLFNHMNLQKNIAIPLQLHARKFTPGQTDQTIKSLVPHFFGNNKNAQILQLMPSTASGGEKQRASIMRAVINSPSIILADEPTASLNGTLKNEVVKHLQSLCNNGHTVIVVSHDSVFYHYGRQLELKNGELKEISTHDAKPAKQKTLSIKSPTPTENLFWGWKPRASMGVLFNQIIQETLSRPIFLSLILIALIVGVCQVSVFSSVIIGVQNYVDDAMTTGSRLNRVEIKPKKQDRSQQNRFPVKSEIASWDNVDDVVPRRITLARLMTAQKEVNTYTVMGLHQNDPEYNLLEFVAGGTFTGNHDQLEVIVTVALLGDLFDTLESGETNYQSFIGKKVGIILLQFTKFGKIKKETTVFLTIKGIILHAEGGRQLYLPNTTHLVFDRYKMDRVDKYSLPLNDAADTWQDQQVVLDMANFPWEDSLHIYAKEMRDVMPIIKDVAKLGYKPKSDIWQFKWALDIQDTAWNIFLPLLILIILGVAITVSANIFTSAKLRERELALWRVLGMRRGDLVLTQVLSTVLSVTLGTIFGLAMSWVIVEQSKSLLVQRSAEAAMQSAVKSTQNFDAIFAPVSQFYLWIFLSALVIGIIASLYPAFRTAKTDPAKVLQS
ncbi:ABC transporter ATP-binding protein [Candidatus Thiomargarita nelsonii]|uniref:ABC transporter ATP-binding protein n=1 Tax=Candidatus Thiomargarita nelsonii TaxID=1003181 RepID=A0A4E0QMH1_9GAMM|nr:ABC transporter ATP-binding protein [Candidatus Thiomargarita nelsonii]